MVSVTDSSIYVTGKLQYSNKESKSVPVHALCDTGLCEQHAIGKSGYYYSTQPVLHNFL